MSKQLILTLGLFCFMIALPLRAEKPLFSAIEGQDYMQIQLQSAKNSETKQPHNQIEVVEFFSYGCPYCAQVEPYLQQWMAQKPDNVTLKRIAVPRKGRWVEYARIFYTLSLLEPTEEKRLTPLLYKAIHEEKQDLNNETTLLAWVEKQGVNRTKLTELYYSDEVTKQLEQAMKMINEYGVKSVPALYVDGRYQLLLNSKNGYNQIVPVLNQLTLKAQEK